MMEKMKNNTLIGVCLFISLVILGIFYVNENYNIKDWLNNIHKIDTVYTTKTDTLWKDTVITKTELVPKYIYKTKVDTVYDKEQNPIELVTENKVYSDTILCEKDTAELQIFTSGIKSNVDSISLKLRKSEIIKTNTIEITKYVEREKKFIERFHFSPQVGFGYGLANKKFDTYIGVGVGYEF